MVRPVGISARSFGADGDGFLHRGHQVHSGGTVCRVSGQRKVSAMRQSADKDWYRHPAILPRPDIGPQARHDAQARMARPAKQTNGNTHSSCNDRGAGATTR